ncbi:MAG: ABC transporter substrate-binding protein, partial [Ilumatobacteraceae bacterium]
ARFTLNEQCVPQLVGLSPAVELGDVAQYPWTTGALPTAAAEVEVFGTLLRQELPHGGTIGVYYAEGTTGAGYDTAVKNWAAGSGFQVVAEQSVAGDATLPATAQVAAVAAPRPDVVIAAPEGLDCALFLKQLAIQRGEATGWKPMILLSSACAVKAVMTLAGPSSDGVYSTTDLVDVGPTSTSTGDSVGVQAYRAWMSGSGLLAEVDEATRGWTAAETLVQTIRQAMAAAGGLSQVSLIEAARAIDFTPSLARPGVQYRTNGATDPFLAQSLQIMRWGATMARFTEVGPVITKFESS